MKIDIVTLFPDMYTGPFSESIIKRAIEKGLVEIKLHYLRDWGFGNYKQIDDRPFGGGAGMVLMYEPMNNCLKELRTEKSHVIAMDAKGKSLKQSRVNELVKHEHLIILAGHYEGFDHRILKNLVDEVISVGQFVVSGGELPSMMLADSIIRLLPGSLGNEESPISDSYYEDDQTKQYPQYTRPASIITEEGKELKVPDVLLNGNHAEIDKWRKQSVNPQL